jgi:CheY-like chemotaxis protein
LTDAYMPIMDGFRLAEQIKQRPELAAATIMMLTSGGQRGDAARCRELGVAAYLTKPVRQSELRAAIDAALIRTSPEQDDRRTEPLITRHTKTEERHSSKLRVLLAEDNVVNQHLAVRLIEKHGHTVVVTNNGREALAALENEAFDLLLMDVQMPEMDGFEATGEIRKRENTTGRHLPIVAMTAHAMKGIGGCHLQMEPHKVRNGVIYGDPIQRTIPVWNRLNGASPL